MKNILSIFLLTNLISAESNNSSTANSIGNNNQNIFSKLNVDVNPQENSENKYNEDIHLPFSKLINKYGYPVEEHEVKTSDGYLLTMFRIPKKGPPVLLIHGGGLSSDDFATIGPQAGLLYVLANAGYDVWLGNCRGNKHSLRHVTLPIDSAAYWDFTWDEMGRYDMPALIDFILNTTETESLKLIGYSLGTTVLAVLCSEKPEYNKKISVMVLLSPTVNLAHSTFLPLRLLAGSLTPDIYMLAKSIGLHSMLTDMEIGPIVEQLKNIFCVTPETADFYCHNMLTLVFGINPDQVNKTSLPVIYGHMPTSISIKSSQHTTQMAISGKFRRYDYGKASNILKYGSSDPPEYPLEKVSTKVAIGWAENDYFCREQDLQILLSKLPNVVDIYKVPLKAFTHTDFIFAKDVKTLLYDHLLEILQSN